MPINVKNPAPDCVQIKTLKQGDFFRLTNSDTAPVWVRSVYVRECKKYECFKYDDVNHFAYLTGTRYVYTNFTF
jgi:hypothetical protein